MSRDESPPGHPGTPSETPLALAATAPGSSETAPAPSLAPPSPVSVPEQRYELGELLGKGGMGEVYKARDRRLNRFVAIKFLRAEHDGARARFLQEARAQARIDHENVCRVHEVGELHGRPFIAMELLQGLPMHQVMAQFSLEEKLCILRDAAAALHSAHRLGIIHRDVKPSNLVVYRREDGTWRPVLMDFGLAHDPDAEHHLTKSGVVMGTPAYMSPEQARGDSHNPDRRTDVYGLGATLFELLTGRPPFVGDHQTQVLLQVLSQEPPLLRTLRPGLPPDLETLVHKCLHRDPAQRYQSARAVAEDLQRYLNGEPILGRRSSLLYRLRRKAQKNRGAVALGVLALVGLSVLGAYGFKARLQVRHEQAQAAERAKLSQELGQSIKEMEWFMRAVHDLPPHDTTYAQSILHARMQKLAALRHGLGSTGAGLVQYAIGHAHVALQDFDRAYEQLVSAQRQGNDTPELRGTLGRVLGEQYKKKMEEALRTGDVSFVKARKQELRDKYVKPAVALLRSSQEAELSSPQLLEGLIALYSEQYDEALQKADEVTKQAPWRYEAKQLAGDVHFARGIDLRNDRKLDEAKRSFERAVGKYKEAAEIGRSDVSLYEAIAESYLQWGDIAVNLQDNYADSAPLEQAKFYCQTGVTISPARSPCYSKLARAYALAIQTKIFLALPIEDELQKLLRVAKDGIALDPTDAYIYDSLGVAYTRASWGATEQAKVDDYLRLAAENYRQALARQPKFPVSLTNLGILYLTKQEKELCRTGALTPVAYEQGLQSLRAAVDIDPNYSSGWRDLFAAHSVFIQQLIATGQDPSTRVHELMSEFRKFRSLNPTYADATFMMSATLHEQNEYSRWMRDEAALAKTLAEQRALAAEAERLMSPTDADLPFVRLFLAVDEAQLRVSHGQDPSESLGAGREAISRCEAFLGALQARCLVAASALELVAAEYAQSRRQPVLPYLRQAVADVRRALAVSSTDEDQYEHLARALLRLAEAQAPESSRGIVAEGIEAATKALQLCGASAKAHALRARLYLLQARTASSAKERLALARKAQGDFAQAVANNPLLAKVYRTSIAQAQALVAQLAPK